MLRQTSVYLALFLIGMISSQDLLVPTMEETDQNCENLSIETNGKISIHSVANTNNQIPHQPIDYKPLQVITDVEGLIHYAIGARRSSDRLVASGGQNQSWPSPHNVNIQLSYPSQGYGAAVTYVAIVVNQTSSLGKAYVISGGINQHSISIVVEAYNTYVFNVFAYVYGI